MDTQSLASSNHPFLIGLDPEHLEILANFSYNVSFNADDWIFREGEIANRFYLILGGTVCLESTDGYGRANVIQTLDRGDVLGWSWMIPPELWKFSAKVVEPVSAIFFYGTPLKEACEQNPAFGYAILKRISAVLLERLHATRCLLLDHMKLRFGEEHSLDSKPQEVGG